MIVLSAGTSTPDWLSCLPTQIREVVAHGICHGATGALTAAHLHLCHKMDLRKVTPGFPTVEKIPDDVNVERLVAEFSGNAEAIAVVVDVERIIKDAPL
jgi:hypothetical protein